MRGELRVYNNPGKVEIAGAGAGLTRLTGDCSSQTLTRIAPKT